MIIFRVERVDKIGPYSGGPGARAQKDYYDDMGYVHPTPCEDKGLKGFVVLPDHHFGFVSMEQLENWWPQENWKHFIEFNKEGRRNAPERIYGISEYEVHPEHVEVGDKQLVFRMSEAKRLIHTPFILDLANA